MKRLTAPALPPRAGRQPPLPVVPKYLVDEAERAIDRADSKATALGAAATAILAITTGTMSGLRSGCPAPAPATDALGYAAALGWLAGIFALAAAVLPRLRTSGGAGRLASFRDFPPDFDLDRVRALAERTSADLEVWLLTQGHVLSRIAVAKYRMIRLGMGLLCLGALLGLLGTLSQFVL
ncbi:MAG TPA: Pycsar system effector family protein [Actinocrinis sp.]|nr:Pycsar system effector family protein [Actinocrinis sp.]